MANHVGWRWRSHIRVGYLWHRLFTSVWCLVFPVNRGSPGDFATAGGFNEAFIDADVGQIESDDAVVGFQIDLFQLFENSGFDLFIPAGAQGGGRTGGICDLGIGSAWHEDCDELVEDGPIGG